MYYWEMTPSTTLSPERIQELAKLAFKLSGYEMLKSADGQVAVRCSPRTAQLMVTFQQLLASETQ